MWIPVVGSGGKSAGLEFRRSGKSLLRTGHRSRDLGDEEADAPSLSKQLIPLSQSPLCSVRTVRYRPQSSHGRGLRSGMHSAPYHRVIFLSPKHEARRPLQSTRPASHLPQALVTCCCLGFPTRHPKPCWTKETCSWGQVPALSFPCQVTSDKSLSEPQCPPPPIRSGH